jgi:AcrR family transcriptional regulator
MKNETIIREALIKNTTRLIGEGGFEKSTTNAIVHDMTHAPGIKLNEVYIYRIFGSKERLYADVFAELDTELFATVAEALDVFERKDIEFRERLSIVFDRLWRFLLGNEIKTRCYVRYFYSTYYREKSHRDHRKKLDAAAQRFAPAFTKESNVHALIHAVFMTMLDFAIQVHNGDLEDNEDTAYHVFNLLYHSLYCYLREDLRS